MGEEIFDDRGDEDKQNRTEQCPSDAIESNTTNSQGATQAQKKPF
jgi:hypothetical protein